jgi:hypothetical protein
VIAEYLVELRPHLFEQGRNGPLFLRLRCVVKLGNIEPALT